MAPDWDEDEELLAAWQQGDDRAGEALFDRHASSVSRFFANKVSVGTEDLIQTTFMRMLEGKARVRRGRSFRAWVLGVAQNVLREYLRQLARGRGVDPEVDSVAQLAPGPTTVIGGRAEHRLLLEGLRQLPLDHQILLELVYWERLKSRELAEFFGISASAVRSRVKTARELLAKKMADIARSARLLDSTVEGLEGWAAEIREQLGRKA